MVDAASGIGLPVAFGAGLISFLSPCVLPLVPGYLSYVAGLSGSSVVDGEAGSDGAGGTMTRGIDNAVANSQAWSAPAPPKERSEKSRGS